MVGYEDILNYATAAALGVSATSSYTAVKGPFGLLASLALCFVSALALVFAGTCQYLRQQRPCNTLSWRGFIGAAMIKLLTVTVARYKTWKLRRAYRSRSAMRAMQEETLMQLVKQSKDTVFGRDHRFAEICGIDDYRAYVPVRDYADLDKYYQLTYKGEPNVFFKGRPDYLFKTSGTTGKNKTYPVNGAVCWKYLLSLMPMYYVREILVGRYQRRSPLDRMLIVRNLPKDTHNEFGMSVGPLSKYFHTDADIYTTPHEVFQKVHDAPSGFYIHSVFALWHERIGEVNVFFPTNLITFMRCLSANWESVLRDIEAGRLSADKLNVDAELVKDLNRRLTPKPERAAQLRSLFGDGRDLTGFFEKAWPDVPCMMLARSGSFQSSYEFLKKFLGNVPTFCPCLMSTEGIFGLNLSLKTDEEPDVYHPMLAGTFVEFIQVDANGNDLSGAKLASELQVGCLYETVATSFNCYRLRVGDVIKVVSMDECAPVFEISHRKSHVLSVHVEKTTEKSLQACVLLAAQRLGCQVVDFSAADCFLYEPVAGVSLGTKYYAMFIELDGNRRLTDDEKLVFDTALRDSLENYELFRTEGDIDKMQVVQVVPGAFGRLRQRMMELNTDISEAQFKMPRVIKSSEHLRCLLEQRA